MSEIGNFLDGRVFLASSPFRSTYFLILSTIGLGCIALDAYLMFRYWRLLDTNAVVALGILIGVQSIYQWWRALRYYAKLREVYLQASRGDLEKWSALEIALGIGAGGITDVLFFSFGTTLFALIYISSLLARLGR